MAFSGNASTVSRDPRAITNISGGLVAIGLLGLLGFALYALVKFDVRPDNHDMLLVLITFLTTKMGTVVDFFYGSSATNKGKDETIGKLAMAAATPDGDTTSKTVSTTATAPSATGTTSKTTSTTSTSPSTTDTTGVTQ